MSMNASRLLRPSTSANRSPWFAATTFVLALSLLAAATVAHEDDDDDDDAPPNQPPPQIIVPDADGDGLPWMQERLLGTSFTTPDSDGDGYSDLEEIARHSSPLSSTSIPPALQRLGVGVMVHAQNDGLHGLVSVYMSDTDLRTKRLKIGFVSPDRYIEFSNAALAQYGTISFHPSSTSSGMIALIDVRFPASMVHAMGGMAFFARAAVPGATTAVADGAYLLSSAGLVLWSMPAPAPVLQHAGCSASSGGTPGGGSIYVPLVPMNPPGGGSGSGGGVGGGGSGGTTIPATWEPGSVCFQRASPIGANGATITNEIVAAECVDDWEGFCPPGCSQSVGTTYRTIDPVVLIGG